MAAQVDSNGPFVDRCQGHCELGPICALVVATDITEPPRAGRIGGEKQADLWASRLVEGERQVEVQHRLMQRYEADRVD